MYAPGDTIYDEFHIHVPGTSGEVDADSLPTALLLRNGTDSGESVTVTNKATGCYSASVVIPSGWSIGDSVQLRMTATVGGVTANDGSDVWQLQASSGVGTGARTITFTVDDGTDPLENATVRVTKGAVTLVANTDASGLVVFNVNDGTWTVACTLSGYTYAGSSLAVSGDATPTLSMTASSFTPSTPGLVTGYLYCYDEDGTVEADVDVVCTVAEPGVSDVGVAYDGADRTETSDAVGLVEFTNIFKGVTYTFSRGTSTKQYTVTIPSDAADNYELPSLIGAP